MVLVIDSGSPTVPKKRLLHGPAVDQVLAQENVWDGSGTVGLSSAARVTWLMGDNQNSVRDLVDNSGGAVTNGHFVYDAFGAIVSGDASLTRYHWAGRELDTATGLQHNRAREYDPETGRFMSEDPSGFSDGPNPYIYVHNNPTNYIDPNGREAIAIGVGGAAAAAAAAAEAAAAAAAVASAAAAVAAGYGGYKLGCAINNAGYNPFTAAVNWWYASAAAYASQPARDPAVQAEIDQLSDEVAELADKIKSISDCDYGYGKHNVSGSLQELKELTKKLADLIAKNPPK